MITILATIFVLGVLTFVHETGHFLSAKLFRIRVDRFSLGLPPRLIGKKIGDTDYCISSIPFGSEFSLSIPIFGFGPIKITATVEENTINAKGFVLFFFVLILS